MSLVCALTALMMILAMPTSSSDARAEEDTGVTFVSVDISPDPLPVGDTLVVEAQITSDSNVTGVEMYYCNDDMCLPPDDMEDEGSGLYSYRIYADGSEPNDGDPIYYTEDQSEVWVKIRVITGAGDAYYPSKDDYVKVSLDYSSADGDDGGDGDGDDDDDDDDSTPGFEAVFMVTAFAAVTGVALMRRRLHL
jgi:hypothetical protein